MFFNPLALYTEQFKNHLNQYEKNLQEKRNLTDDYVTQRKQQFRDIEDKINYEFNLIKYMNYSDLYLNIVNMNLPKMYLDIYLLWLEKMKDVYELDTNYFVDLVKLTYPILHETPFLKNYNIFDIYRHFNFLSPIEK